MNTYYSLYNNIFILNNNSRLGYKLLLRYRIEKLISFFNYLLHSSINRRPLHSAAALNFCMILSVSI